MARFPLLFLGFFLLLGCGFALYPHWIYVFPFSLLLFATPQKKWGLFFLLFGILWTHFRYPDLKVNDIKGAGAFHLKSVKPSQSPFHRSLALSGLFTHFETKQGVYYNIPATLFLPKLPQEGKSWLIKGKIQNGIFKPDKKQTWITHKRGFSLPRHRFQLKEKVRRHFHKRFSQPRIQHFFASMATGDMDDRLLAMEFQKLGLGHILAISGFHFALLAGFFGLLFRLILPRKVAYCFLFFLLTLYFLYLGPTPSILRAYTMIALFLIGRFLDRTSSPLNLLGASLCLELFIDPLYLRSCGFQLSFLATFGILLFFRPAEKALQTLLPSRSLKAAQSLSFVEKHGHILAYTLRQGLALNLAVHIATLPLVFFTFHVFPLLTIPYNLIVPPLLSLSLILLPLGLLLPPLAKCNAFYTKKILHLIANPPELLNYKIFIPTFPFPLLILCVTSTLIFGLTLWRKQDKTMG